MLGQPGEIMNVDSQDPMWNRNEFRAQRQPGPITFLPHSQPVLEHFRCRRATTDDEQLASSREIFSTRVDAVFPASRFEMKVVRKTRLTDDAGRIDDMTSMQLLSVTIAVSISN